MNRRQFVQSLGLVSVAAQLPSAVVSAAASTVRPKRLSAGDTVALVSPASATFNSLDLQIARESLEALGFKVRPGEHMMERHGYLAGSDKARAEDINRAFADRAVAGIHAIRGGWGSARLLPYLDFDTIRRNPKVLIGYSDITALLLSIHAKTGLITFHGPIGARPLGRVVARLLPARPHERRSRHLLEQAGSLRRAQQPDPGRVPNADDHARQGARPTARRQPDRADRDPRLALPAGVGRRDSVL